MTKFQHSIILITLFLGGCSYQNELVYDTSDPFENTNRSLFKINENLEAEALNIIYNESIDNNEKGIIFQLDTTYLDPQESADKLMNFMNGTIKLDETFDYSERIMDWY